MAQNRLGRVMSEPIRKPNNRVKKADGVSFSTAPCGAIWRAPLLTRADYCMTEMSCRDISNKTSLGESSHKHYFLPQKSSTALGDRPHLN
jgi:hypothetical protein